MSLLREQHLVGLDHLEAVTSLLQRVRGAHPTKGLDHDGNTAAHGLF